MLKRAVQQLRPQHSAACMCPSCNMTTVRRLVSLTAPRFLSTSTRTISSATNSNSSACRCPSSQHSIACRTIHTRSTRNAKKDDSLDDLFGEEVATSGSKPSSSRLASLLRTTQAVTNASAAANVASAAAEQASAAQEDAYNLLSELNPPKLDRKQLNYLRVALKDVQKKKAIALQGAGASTGAADVNVQYFAQQEALLEKLVAAVFPPEVSINEKEAAEILDFAESMPGVLKVMTPDQLDPMKLMSIDHKTTRKNRHMYCLFCKPSTAMLPKNKLVYTNLNLLTQFINERGMIQMRSQTRLCMKHQRSLARIIKQSRSIGLLSPQSNWRIDQEFVYGSKAGESSSKSASKNFTQFDADPDTAEFDAASSQFGDNQPLGIDSHKL